MKIYTVYDKDTGVYYAVTEKGGICVMETMSGETKLVDQGEPPIVHPNQGQKMPKSLKPIVCINGSRSIKAIDLDRFINPDHVGAVVTGGAAGVDTIAEH